MIKIKEIEQSALLNNLTARDYYIKLKMLAISLFKWENLDEICGFGSEIFLEENLFLEGKMCFIKDDKIGYQIMRITENGNLNNYNLPTKINAYAQEFNKTFNIDEIVYIMNNRLQEPTKTSIELASNRLYEIQRTIDINLENQKTPIVFEGDKKSILSLKNAYLNFKSNVPVMFTNKNFEMNNRVNCLKTNVPLIAKELNECKKDILNETLTFLGINNVDFEKKERLVTDEVNANNDMINYFLNCFYEPRKKACEQINKILEKNNIKTRINLTINKDVKNILEKTINNIEKGDIHE